MKRLGRGRVCGKASTLFHPGRFALLCFASVVILPPRFLGFSELGVADMAEVPERLLIRSNLPKVADMVKDTRVPLRFFKKGICDRRTAGENLSSEEEEETRKEARAVEDARIPFRYFRNLHTPIDILEACSGEKDEKQKGKREAPFKDSDLVLQDVNEKGVFYQMEKDPVCTRELLKQIGECGRVD